MNAAATIVLIHLVFLIWCLLPFFAFRCWLLAAALRTVAGAERFGALPAGSRRRRCDGFIIVNSFSR
jgi:hypothetical protein